MSYSDEIKKIRKKYFLSQEAFGREIGVSFSSINRWEGGKSKPNMAAMKSLKIFVIFMVLTLPLWKNNGTFWERTTKIMAKKKTEDTINLDSILFKCRDILRAARNSGSFFEKRDMMLTLVFLRFIGEKYEDGIEKLRQILIEQGLDPDDENIRAAFFDDATFADGTYNLPPEARWSTIINTPAPKLNVALDNALHSIAASSKQLKGCFVEGTFTTRNLAPNDIKKLIDEVNKISHKKFGEEKDLIGRVYEYFLKEFAVNATKEEGEFYTPHDVVQLIATMIEPYDGTLYDPCCGSGGMFIQSAALVKSKQGDINRINVYGQEKEPATYRLAKMNLALRGISHNLGETSDSSFLNDLHKGLYFDYIMQIRHLTSKAGMTVPWSMTLAGRITRRRRRATATMRGFYISSRT